MTGDRKSDSVRNADDELRPPEESRRVFHGASMTVVLVIVGFIAGVILGIRLMIWAAEDIKLPW